MPNPRMTLREFIDGGYLQEVNRQFFHPLGKCLVVRDGEQASETTEFTPDLFWIESTEDPEGFEFGKGGIATWEKADKVHLEWQKHREARQQRFDCEWVPGAIESMMRIAGPRPRPAAPPKKTP